MSGLNLFHLDDKTKRMKLETSAFLRKYLSHKMDSRAVGINKIVPHVTTVPYESGTTGNIRVVETTAENAVLPDTGSMNQHVEEIVSGRET